MDVTGFSNNNVLLQTASPLKRNSRAQINIPSGVFVLIAGRLSQVRVRHIGVGPPLHNVRVDAVVCERSAGRGEVAPTTKDVRVDLIAQ